MTVMGVARTEAIGAEAGATNGVMKGVIVATVTRRVTSAVIVGITVGASAAMIAVKISPVRTAVIASRPAVKTALPGRCRAMVLVADAKGPTAAVKRPAIRDNMESVEATGAMKVMTGAREHCAYPCYDQIIAG